MMMKDDSKQRHMQEILKYFDDSKILFQNRSVEELQFFQRNLKIGKLSAKKEKQDTSKWEAAEIFCSKALAEKKQKSIFSRLYAFFLEDFSTFAIMTLVVVVIFISSIYLHQQYGKKEKDDFLQVLLSAPELVRNSFLSACAFVLLKFFFFLGKKAYENYKEKNNEQQEMSKMKQPPSSNENMKGQV